MEVSIPEEILIKVNKGDTLIFKTDNNVFDTLLVEIAEFGVADYYTAGWYECDNGVLIKKYADEYFVYFENIYQNNTIKSINLNQLYPGFTFEAYVNSYKRVPGSNKIGKYKQRDSIYDDVSILKNNSIIIYSNLKYGIIKYHINNEDTFRLYKYIPYNK